MWWAALFFAAPPADIPLRIKLFAPGPTVEEVQQIPAWASTGRLIDEPRFHLGVRPHVYYCDMSGEVAGAVTVQISLSWP